MKEQLGVVPGGFASGGHAPCSEGVVERGDRGDGVAQEPHTQGDFGGVDEAVKRGVEGSVVVVLNRAVLGCDGRGLACGENGLGKIVIDVGVIPAMANWMRARLVWLRRLKSACQQPGVGAVESED